MSLLQIFHRNVVSSIFKHRRASYLLPSVNARFMCTAPEVAPENLKEKDDGESSAAKRESLIEENKALLDKYIRVLAETENLRRSSSQQLEAIKTAEIESFSHELVRVADKFNRALMSVKEEEKEQSSDLNKLCEAGQMIRDSMLKSFAKQGLVPFDVEIGQMFDSNQHEQMYEMASYHEEPGKILHQVRPGYQFNNHTIRLPGVGVAVLRKNESSDAC